MISREWNSIPHSPWKIRTGLCIGIQVLKRWDFTAREISYPHPHLHPLSLPIFQVLFLPQAFLSTEVYPGSSLVTQLLHLSFSWHSTPQLKFPWIPYCPGTPTLLPVHFLASFAGVTWVGTDPWPSALLSQFLPSLWCLTQSHSFSYFLPTDDSQIWTFKILYSLPSS